MKCKHPIVIDKKKPDIAFPCGQCLHCRINKRRVWASRIMLESMLYLDNAFVTLTYNDQNLPESFENKKTGQVYAPCSVNPDHHKEFMYRLRTLYRRKTGKNIRFFAVGEYGEQTGRPHYHYALFNFPISSGRGYGNERFNNNRCFIHDLVQKAWSDPKTKEPYGNVHIGTLTHDSAQYIAGYVTKKMTSDNTDLQQEYLQGRHPEFTRQSRRPGIGADYANLISKRLTRHEHNEYSLVPNHIKHGSKKRPLGRYMMDKIYEDLQIQFEHGDRLKLYERVLRSVLANAEYDSDEVKKTALSGSLSLALEKINQQYNTNIESKLNFFNKRKII